MVRTSKTYLCQDHRRRRGCFFEPSRGPVFDLDSPNFVRLGEALGILESRTLLQESVPYTSLHGTKLTISPVINRDHDDILIGSEVSTIVQWE